MEKRETQKQIHREARDTRGARDSEDKGQREESPQETEGLDPERGRDKNLNKPGRDTEIGGGEMW